MLNPKISLILPTYNVARFLQQCLESIACQTYTNYEVVIIVDGATDGSYEIAKNFCATHEKFSVYWQENAGSGPARNNGLDHASGELIMFIDPDDWVDSDYVEKLVQEQQKKNYDYVVAQCKNVYCTESGKILKTKLKSLKEYEFFSKEECRKRYMQFIEEDLVNAPTYKVYKKSIIDQNDIRFPDLRRSQDVVFNYRYFNCINCFRSVAYFGYNYRVVFGENILRVKPDHYKILHVLYRDIVDLHKSWDVVYDLHKTANYFFRIVYTCLLTNAAVGSPLVSVYTDSVVCEITRNARPRRKHMAVVRWCLVHRQYKLLLLALKLLYWAKGKKES